MMLCHEHVDWSMSAVTAGTWHMATNAVGDATHVTKSVHQSAHAMQASTDAHAVVALEDITSVTCRKKSIIRLHLHNSSMYCQNTPKLRRHMCTLDIQCSKTQ